MHRIIACSAALLAASPAAAQIKIAFIDPLTGPFANTGEGSLRHVQAAAEAINHAGGVLGGQKLEVVPLDNGANPQQSLIMLQAAVDQGIHFVVQGNGSSVTAALIQGATKIADRAPEKAVLILNYTAADPELTNARCSFWHFRFDSNNDQKLEALITHLANQKGVKKVYIIGQDYAHGQSVSRITKELLKRKRPDIAVVGDDLHPLGKVKDFSPYVSKIKASGAEAVVTGNWGSDLSLLVKAARDAGVTAVFYTYFAGSIGTPTAIGSAGAGHVLQVTEWHPNLEGNKAEAFVSAYNKRNPSEFWQLRIKTEIDMLARAIDQAGSADPVKVARALEDMRYPGDAGEVWMRKDDHQMQQALYISSWEKAGTPGVKYQTEKTGYGFRSVATVPASALELPTTCRMQRP